MLKRVSFLALTAVLAVVLVACWPTPKRGPQATTGRPITIYALVDPGIEKSFNDYQVRNRRQTAEYMEKDLKSMLEKAGYAAHVIDNRSAYRPGPGAYLLTVKITSYNPGVKAVRMYVGYGAGAASMHTHYELYGSKGQKMLSDNVRAGTGGAWEKAIRKIDVTTIDAISTKLGGGGE
jgi:hypothetical protein